MASETDAKCQETKPYMEEATVILGRAMKSRTFLFMILGLLSLAASNKSVGSSARVNSIDPRESRLVIERLPPPYSFQISTLAELVYRVPTARLQALVPSPYRVLSVGGHSFVTILVTHYTQVETAVEGNEIAPYDEVSYLTQVVHEGVGGNYFFRLHLNSREAWILGRELYGFNKDLALIRICDQKSSLSVEVEESPTLAPTKIEFEKRGWITKPVAVIKGFFSGTFQSLYPKIFFKKDSELLMANSRLRVNNWKVRQLKLHSAELPIAIQGGLLMSDEVLKPWVALYYERALFTLAPAVPARK
jgi:hypothetical protein